MEAAMFFTVAQTGQTKRLSGSLSCLEGESEVKGIQLQHVTSPLEYTHWTFKIAD